MVFEASRLFLISLYGDFGLISECEPKVAIHANGNVIQECCPHGGGKLRDQVLLIKGSNETL